MTAELDVAVLAPIFAAHRPDSQVRSVERSAVGNGQETWFVDTDRGQFVLRRTAAGGTQEWTDRRSEFEVLAGLADLDLPVPAVHWFEPDGGSLTRAYFVMDRLPGRPLGLGSAELNPVVARHSGELLARLHAATVVGPVDARQCAEDQLVELRATAMDEPWTDLPLVGALLGWLHAHRPTGPVDRCRLWGDPGPHNMLVVDGRVTALLDWELSHLGDPLDDLGGAVWSCLGIIPPDEVIGGYEVVAGPVDRTRLVWWEVFAHVKRSAMTLSGSRAFVEGRSESPSLAGLGLALVATSLLRAAAAAWDMDLAPLDPRPVEAFPSDAALPPTAADLRTALDRCRARLTGQEGDGASARVLRIVDALAAVAEPDEGRTGHYRRFTADRSGDESAAALAEHAERDRAQARIPAREAMVLDMLTERARLGPLLELYGPTTHLPGVD